LAARAEAIITAALRPDLFAGRGLVSVSRTVLITTLSVLVLVGMGIRLSGLSAEGLSEDELNKLQAVGDYRANGLTAANSEHPFLMKALQTGSLFLADRWNSSSFGSSRSISPETALRLPGAIFGALTVILIYLLAAELFGAEVGLIAAALWAFDPTAISLNRIAKEDTFLLFFFLLGNLFWLRGQRVTENQSSKRPQKYYWAAAASLGAMMASKYLPQALTITFAYYWMFQRLPETRWRLGKKRVLFFFFVMGLTFLVLNPTILLPATWRQMSAFAGQKLIGHDAYEFMGRLYTHRMTDWLKGIPWYFYHVMVAVKLPVLTVLGFLVGLPLLFRRKLGDGRYFIGLWLFLWMMTFCFTGGKFTRYFTLVLPAVLITAAIGVQFVGCKLAGLVARLLSVHWPRMYLHPALALLVVVGSIKAAADAAPHFRLYTNELGGGMANAGYFFPHDEFYDAAMRDAVFEIAKRAAPRAKVASESPALATYYAQRAGRSDLVCINLSDPEALKQLGAGDFIIDARGRRYFSNDVLLSELRTVTSPAFTVQLGDVRAASVFMLDEKTKQIVSAEVQNLKGLREIFWRWGGTKPAAP
jgi:hypothetical protein